MDVQKHNIVKNKYFILLKPHQQVMRVKHYGYSDTYCKLISIDISCFPGTSCYYMLEYGFYNQYKKHLWTAS